MVFIKNNNRFIILFFIAFTLNAFTMEPIESEEAPTAREESQLGELSIYISDVLLGHKSHSSWFLEKLPSDIQNQINSLLTINDRTDSLNVCAEITNSLAQLNKELNALINDPYFCLQLIKHLAQRFNCSDSFAAHALKTKEGKRRFFLQMELYNLCNELIPQTKGYYCNTLQTLCDQGVDLEFTYDMALTDFQNVRTFPTPLIMASINQNHDLMHCLIEKGSNVNQKAKGGKTALMLMIQFKNMSRDTIQILLDAGASLTTTDNKGNTALTIAKKVGDKRIIKFLQNAMKK